jgi:hypothetical protein
MNPIYDNEEWDLVSYSDSHWPGDPETTISVTEFMICLLNATICWGSKGQKVVTLSSSNADYIAISEAFKEILFIYYLLKGVVVDIKLLILVRCGNVGTIFMAEILFSGVRTRHIDI